VTVYKLFRKNPEWGLQDMSVPIPGGKRNSKIVAQEHAVGDCR